MTGWARGEVPWSSEAADDLQRRRVLLYGVLPAALAVAALPLFGGPQEAAPPGKDDPAHGPTVPPGPLQPRLDAFQRAWNGLTLDQIRESLSADVEAHKSRLLGKPFRRREWVAQRPPTTFQQRDSAVAHQVAVSRAIDGVEKVMQTDWQWEKDCWWLLDLKLRIQR